MRDFTFVIAFCYSLVLLGCELYVEGQETRNDINIGTLPSPVETPTPDPEAPPSPATLFFCDQVEPDARSPGIGCFDEVSVEVGTPRSFFVIAKDRFGVSVPSTGLDIAVRTDTGGPVVVANALDPRERSIQLRVEAVGTTTQQTSATVTAAGTSRGLLITVIP